MYNKFIKKYKLKSDITYSTLKDNNFRNNKCRIDLYKGLIYLIITVELSDKNDEETDSWWTYQVVNDDYSSLYIPYYNRLLGVNELVLKLDKKINKILSNMNDVFELSNTKKEKNNEK